MLCMHNTWNSKNHLVYSKSLLVNIKVLDIGNLNFSYIYIYIYIYILNHKQEIISTTFSQC